MTARRFGRAVFGWGLVLGFATMPLTGIWTGATTVGVAGWFVAVVVGAPLWFFGWVGERGTAESTTDQEET